MEKLSNAEKARAYDEALKMAKSWYIDAQLDFKKSLETLFPELKESEDERVRNKLIEFFKGYSPDEEWWGNITQEDILAWLERKGEKILANSAKTCKIKPKFNEGDWVFIEYVKGYKNGPFQIKVVDSFGYSFDEYYTIPFMYEELLSKWIIQDAKDGDVLAAKTTIGYPNPFIAIYKEHGLNFFNSHCFVSCDGEFHEGTTGHSISDIHPATKEQRDTLEKAMADAGYTFDFEKKELKKIINKEQIKKNLQDNSFRRMFENKPAEWSEEDENNLLLCTSIIPQYNVSTTVNTDNLVDWLKFLKERVVTQSKQKWNYDDEIIIEIITQEIERIPSEKFIDNAKDRCLDWLKYRTKSLKPQSKVELTLLDKNVLEAAIAFVEQNNHFNCWRGVDKHTVLSALYSLRPQNT